MSASEKLPPHNVEAEQAVLGGILIDATALHCVKAWLRPADFFRDSHRLIYEAMLRLDTRGTPWDIVTVTDELERTGALSKAGGVAYIHSLATVVPTAIHVEHYGRIVQRTAFKRRLISFAQTAVRIAYDGTEDIDSSLLLCDTLLCSITEDWRSRQSGSETQPVRGLTLSS
jgi:replicative DNA helicase